MGVENVKTVSVRQGRERVREQNERGSSTHALTHARKRNEGTRRESKVFTIRVYVNNFFFIIGHAIVALQTIL